MATDDEQPERQPLKKRRRPSPVVLLRLASSPTARSAYVVIGALGLAALAVGIVGAKRVRRRAVDPIGEYLEPHYQVAWDEIGPIREQISALFEKVGPEGRRRLASHFQSWVGHFRAS